MLYKNHQVLFQALNEIKKETGQRITLKLTADENAINKIYGNNIVNDISVRYIGYLNKNEIIDQYEHSILVFPSYIETVGLPLKEAKSVGGIILAADCEYAHETIMDYDKAYYFKPDNSSELAGLIISVFNSVFSNKY